jgi:hypothetical protein
VPIDSEVYCLVNNHPDARCQVINRQMPEFPFASRSASWVLARWAPRGCLRVGPVPQRLRALGGHVRRALCERGADVVVAYAVDRVSRNQNQIGVLFDEVQQAGARHLGIQTRLRETSRRCVSRQRCEALNVRLSLDGRG